MPSLRTPFLALLALATSSARAHGKEDFRLYDVEGDGHLIQEDGMLETTLGGAPDHAPHYIVQPFRRNHCQAWTKIAQPETPYSPEQVSRGQIDLCVHPEYYHAVRESQLTGEPLRLHKADKSWSSFTELADGSRDLKPKPIARPKVDQALAQAAREWDSLELLREDTPADLSRKLARKSEQELGITSRSIASVDGASEWTRVERVDIFDGAEVWEYEGPHGERRYQIGKRVVQPVEMQNARGSEIERVWIAVPRGSTRQR
jgi:hypothetical protein